LEKVHQNKQIQIFIEENNDIFEHPRRWKQIKDLIENKKLQATFIAKSPKAKDYFEKVWLPFFYKYKNNFLRNISLAYFFLFDIRKYHQALLSKKHYMTLLFTGEAIAVLLVMYTLYALVLPSTKVIITPNYNVEDIIYNFRYYPSARTQFPQISQSIGIPYYSWFIEHSYDMTINIESLLTEQQPSHGKLTIFNETKNEYSIIKNTTFITPEGLTFHSDKAFVIPAKIGEKNGQTSIDVTASPTDIYSNVIGQRWNINPKHIMHIKNIKESYFLKKIYAVAENQFTGWVTHEIGNVTAKDIHNIDEALDAYIQTNKKDILRKHFDIPNAILLHFDNLISYDIINTQIHNNIGDPWPHVAGQITARINFLYIKQSDIAKSILHYINQRQTDTEVLIDINIQSLTLYSIKSVQKDVFVIPTSVSVIRWYNFEKDKNNIKQTIKDNIVGKNENQARNYILSFPEISTAKINIRPPRYKQVSSTKSRIFFEIKK